MTELADLDARIAASAAALRGRDRAARRLAELEDTLADHERRVSELVARLGDEESDVTRLEGLSLGRVVAALRGSRADDLARERAERDAVAYRLTEARARRDLVLREHAGLVDRVSARGAVDAEHASALAAKEAYVRAVPGDPRAAELLDLAAARGALDAELVEVDEATGAARRAGQALAEVREHLGSAGAWSTYDTWLGGGAISSMVKQDRLGQAQRAASRADAELAALRRELADVGGDVDGVLPSLEIGGLTRFVDVWFDNIVTDWSVASRISDARTTTDTVDRAVAAVLAGLSRRRTDVESRLAQLSSRRDRLLSAG